QFQLYLGELRVKQGRKDEALAELRRGILDPGPNQWTRPIARRAAELLSKSDQMQTMVEFLRSLRPTESKAGSYSDWSIPWGELCIILIEKSSQAGVLDELFKLADEVLDEARQTQGEKCKDVATLLATIGMVRLK